MTLNTWRCSKTSRIKFYDKFSTIYDKIFPSYNKWFLVVDQTNKIKVMVKALKSYHPPFFAKRYHWPSHYETSITHLVKSSQWYDQLIIKVVIQRGYLFTCFFPSFFSASQLLLPGLHDHTGVLPVYLFCECEIVLTSALFLALSTSNQLLSEQLVVPPLFSSSFPALFKDLLSPSK